MKSKRHLAPLLAKMTWEIKLPKKPKGEKGEKGARAKKEKVTPEQFLPSQHAQRIMPCLDEELKKRVEKLDAAKLRPPGEKAARGRVRI